MAKGDVAALDALYDRHSAMVLGLALKITGDRSVAEEVLQETFWQAWRSAAAFQPARGAFTSWLFKMERSLAMDAERNVAAARDR